MVQGDDKRLAAIQSFTTLRGKLRMSWGGHHVEFEEDPIENRAETQANLGTCHDC